MEVVKGGKSHCTGVNPCTNGIRARTALSAVMAICSLMNEEFVLCNTLGLTTEN